MIDFSFYDMQTSTSLQRVTPHMTHISGSPIAYMDEVAFAAMEMGYIAGPSLNTPHHPETRH